MPRIRDLVQQADSFRDVIQRRGVAERILPVFEEGLATYAAWKSATARAQEIREQVNRNSDAFKQSRDMALIEATKALKEESKAVAEAERTAAERLAKIELALPNWLHPDVPDGGEEDARPIAYRGTPRVHTDHATAFANQHPETSHEVVSAPPFHHYELVGDLVDQDIAGDLAQSKFYFEFDGLVLLDLALSMHTVEFFRARGYADQLMIPPYLMRQEVEERICYFEAFEDTIFKVEDGNLVLLPSSEHVIVGYYRDKIFEADELPRRILAWSPCFRREAASHGKDTRGIFRVKQFHKVEIHSIVREGEGDAEVDRLATDIQDFLDGLGLPNRSIVVASADMDKRALRQVDIETWMPGQGRYRETHSIATLGQWVSEKSLLRYRTEPKKNQLATNIYATALAIQRAMCAIAENHFDPATSSIRIPAVLHKYMMGVTEIPVKRKSD